VKKLTLILSVVLLSALLGACSTAGAVQTEEIQPTQQPAASLDVSSAEVEGPPSPPTCIPSPPRPAPNEQDLAVFSPDPEIDWIKGPEDAAITIVEYADFQCPYCSVTSQNLQTLMDMYPDDVRVVYRHFPLASIHDKAIPAAQAVEAAGVQSKDAFWALHDLLYQTQSSWSGYSVEDFAAWVVEVAAELGLDPVQFEADYNSEAIVTKAEDSWIDGQSLGIPGTPYIKINSTYTLEEFQGLSLPAVVEWIKLEEIQFAECPPLTIDSEAEYFATVVLGEGKFVIKLYAESAPLAVNNFIFLAENGWFDGITFHRVITGFMAQTGDPTGTGIGDPGYRFGNEISPNLVFDRAGLVAMANSGPDSNGSQFFITYAPAPNLNGGYTIFGEIVEGMEVVQTITPRNPQQGADLPPGDLIISVTIEKQ